MRTPSNLITQRMTNDNLAEAERENYPAPIENANSGKTAYYDSFWDRIGDYLGITSAENQAQWNESQTQKAWEFDKFMTNLQNEFEAGEAQKERDWAREMRKTEFQDTVQSLIEAGLNPIMAVGSQASTPTGASARASSFVANALGANGVASGTGMSGLASLANSAINVYNAYKSNMNSRFDNMNKLARSSADVYRAHKNYGALEQLDNASSLLNTATKLLTKGKVK